MTYRVRDWNEHFENNRSRELKHLDWVPMPNRMDGDGYTELLDHAEGPAHFGCWCALVEIASRCEIRGTLSRDGAGPHNAASLARISRMPRQLWETVLKRLTDEIRWLEVIEETATSEIPHPPATIPHPPAEKCLWNGTERKGTEGNGTAAARPQNPTPPKAKLTLPDVPMFCELVRHYFPATDDAMLGRILAAAAVADPEITDQVLTKATQTAGKQGQKSAALFVTTVPIVLSSWRKAAS